jgi:hypothetical protein
MTVRGCHYRIIPQENSPQNDLQRRQNSTPDAAVPPDSDEYAMWGG